MEGGSLQESGFEGQVDLITGIHRIRETELYSGGGEYTRSHSYQYLGEESNGLIKD